MHDLSPLLSFGMIPWADQGKFGACASQPGSLFTYRTILVSGASASLWIVELV